MRSSSTTGPQDSPTDTLSPLQRDILKTLLYFDIFNHPLTVEEIYRFLPSNSTSPSTIREACHQQPLSTLVKEDEGFYALRANAASTRSERRIKEFNARRLWKVAQWMGAIISHVPFVRAVGISGELSKGVAGAKADIDFFIITTAHRLWICRTLLILIKKTLLLNSKKYFCLNLFISEDHLHVEVRNQYSATEVATLRPVRNMFLYDRYLEENVWISDFFPNWKKSLSDIGSVSNSRSVLQRILELPFDNMAGNKIDTWLMNRWRNLWRRRYPHLNEEQRDRLFRCRSFISTAYGEDFLSKVIDSYNSRLRKFSIG
ncbi:MAG: hypothetical protein HY562_07420 [Ignavibacteriales bacterium]|nr:hypothetical protein [Ignavibacteriales bacterium]